MKWDWLLPEELRNDSHWWDIYKSSFPLTEQDSRKQILVALEKGIATVGAYKLQGVTEAITVLYRLQTDIMQFIFLNYIAVSAHLRNKKLGGKLLNLLITPSSDDAAIVWEVEDPADANNENDRKLRERRLEFYKREGAQLFHSKFIQPPIDGLHSVPMRLMFRAFNDQINIHEYEREIAESIYFKKYQVVNGMAPELLQNLLGRIFG